MVLETIMTTDLPLFHGDTGHFMVIIMGMAILSSTLCVGQACTWNCGCHGEQDRWVPVVTELTALLGDNK